MTIITLFTYILCGFIENVAKGETQRKGEIKDYLLLAVFVMFGTFFTNMSLNYLTYPLRVMFKSIKVLPVMLVSRFYVGRKYSCTQYLSVLVLTIGITMFTLGDFKNSGTVYPLGFVLIVLGVGLDSLASNYEEKHFFNRDKNCSPSEVVVWSSMFGLFMAIALEAFTGDLMHAIEHTKQHPIVVPYCMAFSIAGYVSTNLIMTLIKAFGATVAEIIKSLRKVLTILFSFIMFSKPWATMHIVGFALFFVSCLITVFDRYQKSQSSNRSDTIMDKGSEGRVGSGKGKFEMKNKGDFVSEDVSGERSSIKGEMI